MLVSTLHTDIPIALYLHVPFCETKCPYCDFNTYASIETLMPGYVEALRHEIGLWGELMGRAPVGTVFFGGGTPSYLPADDIRAVMASVRDAFALDPDAETTLEANPGDLRDAKLAAWLECGFNRLSIGVQSFDDRHLAALGRRHDAAQAQGRGKRGQAGRLHGPQHRPDVRPPGPDARRVAGHAGAGTAARARAPLHLLPDAGARHAHAPPRGARPGRRARSRSRGGHVRARGERDGGCRLPPLRDIQLGPARAREPS